MNSNLFSERVIFNSFSMLKALIIGIVIGFICMLAIIKLIKTILGSWSFLIKKDYKLPEIIATENDEVNWLNSYLEKFYQALPTFINELNLFGPNGPLIVVHSYGAIPQIKSIHSTPFEDFLSNPEDYTSEIEEAQKNREKTINNPDILESSLYPTRKKDIQVVIDFDMNKGPSFDIRFLDFSLLVDIYQFSGKFLIYKSFNAEDGKLTDWQLSFIEPPAIKFDLSYKRHTAKKAIGITTIPFVQSLIQQIVRNFLGGMPFRAGPLIACLSFFVFKDNRADDNESELINDNE